MQIIHVIDDFLYSIFPSVVKGDETKLVGFLTEYYTVGPFKPSVRISGDKVIIDIDSSSIISQESEYRRAVALCEKGRFSDAKPLLEELIRRNPTNSEFHRILGQVHAEQGKPDDAVDSLIDALRWDPKNKWALLMMGNIFGKSLDNLPVAMQYYDQVLKIDPDDFITLNNIGANLLQQKKLSEAAKYFRQSISIKKDYPNSWYGLATSDLMAGNMEPAFENAVKAIKFNGRKDTLYDNSFSLAFDAAGFIVRQREIEPTVRGYFHKLEFDGGVEIEMIEDSSIPVTAKFEMAENYKRDKHVLRYKKEHPAVDHLVMHELVHLDLVIKARAAGRNQVFFSTQEHRGKFMKAYEPLARKLKGMGFQDKMISDTLSGLFDGLNTQAYNAPIDLFIEDFLHDNYPGLRPYQFISVFNQLKLGVQATTDKKITGLFPQDVISKSKVYNLVGALQYKELFGIDLTGEFQPKPLEMKQAGEFYDEFNQYRRDKEPGEEYELVIHWAEDLKLDQYFDLVEERKYRNVLTSIDGLIESREKDPLGLESDERFKERESEKFRKSQEKMGLNMAVVMFMVSALEYFEGMSTDKIREIAFEIALQGTQGINPEKTDYAVSLIPGKVFSGYMMLAYYYVSWKLAEPAMLPKLGLPYDNEYKSAETLHQMKRNG